MVATYSVISLRKSALQALHGFFPYLKHPSGLQVPTIGDLVDVVKLADSDQPDASLLLPAAFYFLATYPLSRIILQQDNHLPFQITERLVIGREHLSMEAANSWRKVLVGAKCKQLRCMLAACDLMISAEFWNRCTSAAVFGGHRNFLRNHNICKTCCGLMYMGHVINMEKIWTTMPQLFNLYPWRVLLSNAGLPSTGHDLSVSPIDVVYKLSSILIRTFFLFAYIHTSLMYNTNYITL